MEKLEKPATRFTRRLRPAERVRQYVLNEAASSDPTGSGRLPSMREIAAHLEVSLATVQSVVHTLNEEGLVVTEANRGSFLKQLPKPVGQSLHIGIDFIQGDEDPDFSWRGSIYGGILDQVLRSSESITLDRYPGGEEGIRAVRAAKSAGTPLDGMIFAQTIADPVVKVCQELGIPFVTSCPVSVAATSGFVAPNRFHTAKEIGRAFRASGRRRIYLVGSRRFEYDPEYSFCYAGLRAGLDDGSYSHRDFSLKYFDILSEATIPKAFEVLFADRKNRPDAIYFFSDRIHTEAIPWLRQAGIRCPEEVSLVSGTGIRWAGTEFEAMTRAAQPLMQMGREAVSMLLESIRSGGKPVPGKYLPCGFMGGTTTLPKENEVLGIAV